MQMTTIRKFCFSQIFTKCFILAKNEMALENDEQEMACKLFHFKHFPHFSRSYFDLSSSECVAMTLGTEMFLTQRSC